MLKKIVLITGISSILLSLYGCQSGSSGFGYGYGSSYSYSSSVPSSRNTPSRFGGETESDTEKEKKVEKKVEREEEAEKSTEVKYADKKIIEERRAEILHEPIKTDSKKEERVDKNKLTIPKAGEHDDNEEFYFYLDFINRMGIDNFNNLYENIKKRKSILVEDKNGNPLRDVDVIVGGNRFTTFNDGELNLYPFLLNKDSFEEKDSNVVIKYKNIEKKVNIKYDNMKDKIVLDTIREEKKTVKADVVFVLDTTGSMGDEIESLRDSIYSIYTRLSTVKDINVDLNFGLVLYKDVNSEYITKVYDLSENIEKLQENLFEIKANGGGDYSEDMLSALNCSLKEIKWRDDSIKLGILMTDAPAHIDSLKDYKGILSNLAKKNIKINTIGASGLDTKGENHLRTLAQLTKGNYVFLTYGEKGESKGLASEKDGDIGKVSHHTGGNYSVRDLDDIVFDMILTNLSYQFNNETLAAFKDKYNYKEELGKVDIRIGNALKQIEKQLGEKNISMEGKSVLILEPFIENKNLDELSKYYTSFASENIGAIGNIKQIDRENFKTVMEEMKLSYAGVTKSEKDFNIKGVDMIMAGKIYFLGNSKVLFIKLVDAYTSEVIAASMVKI